jgi:uncharacterized protein DUF6328
LTALCWESVTLVQRDRWLTVCDITLHKNQPFVFQARGMELSKKLKVALDETRMLILGAQILLGFQFRGVFGDGYDQLPADSRYLSGVALGLMICVVGLLITPGPYHRIVEGGTDSGRFHRLATIVAELSLLPFALALGLDLFITVERILGDTAGAAAGIAAIGLWYGFPQVRRLHVGHRERAMTRVNPRTGRTAARRTG